ncbi:hypothetical protein OF83DRAFT_1156470 [Amylostereum chailletii]|nr:hypothetical protein OF83DRAFT_1156470 [Amylostereum chailletii]
MSVEGTNDIENHLLPSGPPEDATGEDDGSAADSERSTTKVDVDGTPVQLDALGPVVINSDGTLSRITNWQEMTESERVRTLRVLIKRNRIRVSQQKEQAGESLGIAG